mgnify:CR=1 FL=1
MDNTVMTEITWLGDIRITRVFKNDRLVCIKQHEKEDGDLVLTAEEHRTYHDNGRIKEVWNSKGEYFRFDDEGKIIGAFNPY